MLCLIYTHSLSGAVCSYISGKALLPVLQLIHTHTHIYIYYNMYVYIHTHTHNFKSTLKSSTNFLHVMQIQIQTM